MKEMINIQNRAFSLTSQNVEKIGDIKILFDQLINELSKWKQMGSFEINNTFNSCSTILHTFLYCRPTASDQFSPPHSFVC